MSHNSFGHLFRFTTWGESHGPSIGCVIDGTPPRIELSENDIQKFLDKRKPGQSKFTSPRKESDEVKILSGVIVEDGRKLTTGTPISLIIENTCKFSGNINSEHVRVEGHVTGDITADHLEVSNSGNVDGKLKTNSLSVDSGAQISGNVSRIA